MRVRNEKEVAALKDAVSRCTKSVWLESCQGERIDMKNELSQYLGIAKLLQDENEELELFASAREDQGILMDFISQLAS
jgi:selenophosphate synthetase-related protein